MAAAEPGARGYHELGLPDRTGYATMGADEVLVHGWGIASRFGLQFAPPEDVCTAVLRRILPWAPDEEVSNPSVADASLAQRQDGVGRPAGVDLLGLVVQPARRVDGRTMPTSDPSLRASPG